jgi:hypothetical protein
MNKIINLLVKTLIINILTNKFITNQQFLIWKNGGCRDAIYRVLHELDSDFY